MYLTQQDLINLKLKIKAEDQISAILAHLIKEDQLSEAKADMKAGEDYYLAKHKILDRSIQFYSGGKLVSDESATNNKLVHPFHRNMVDQKVDRVLGEDVTFGVDEKAPEEQVDTTLELLGDDRHKYFKRLAKRASNKGLEWIHVFLDPEGDFRWLPVDSRQIIPIYEGKFEEDLYELIRYYAVSEIDVNGKEEKRWKVEWWTRDDVTYYYEFAKDKFALDPTEAINPRPHWFVYNTQDPENTQEAGSWGRVPFIECRNNDDRIPDLNFYRSLIDDYDFTSSDFSNTLADIQDVIWKLKGYEGENLDAFMKDLKRYKAIKLAAEPEAGAEPEKAEIPTDARGEHMDRLERDIHFFGRGVSMRSKDSIGNNPSGVALKFMFAWLDLKCKDLKSNMDDGIRQLMWFATEYINDQDAKKYDYKAINWTYNDSMIINEAEIIEMVMQSQGIVDDETLLQRHPWVRDVQEVMERMEKQREKYNVDLDDDGDGTDDS